MQIVKIDDARRWRRLYKTRWERAKRKRLRESRFEVVDLEIPRSLAKRLHVEMNVKSHLITVIPSGVEAATQPRTLSMRGQAFDAVANSQLSSRDMIRSLPARVFPSRSILDLARYRWWTLQLNCASHVAYSRSDRLQFFQLPDNHIGVF